MFLTADNPGQEAGDNERKTEGITGNEKPDDNEGTVTQERSHDNVFKASGARSEKAKQVEDDKGNTYPFLQKKIAIRLNINYISSGVTTMFFGSICLPFMRIKFTK